MLKVGKQERKIQMECGVRQGDSFAPTLFILVMQVVSQAMQDEYEKCNIDLSFFAHNSYFVGPIRLHKSNTVNTNTNRLPQLLYVDDEPLVFTKR